MSNSRQSAIEGTLVYQLELLADCIVEFEFLAHYTLRYETVSICYRKAIFVTVVSQYYGVIYFAD